MHECQKPKNPQSQLNATCSYEKKRNHYTFKPQIFKHLCSGWMEGGERGSEF